MLYNIYYWSSSTMDSNVDLGAIAFNNLNIGGYYRYYDFSVRAVCSPKEDIPTIIATLHFDANGGSGEMTAISVWSDDSSTSFTLPSNSFVRDGYKFIGWNTKADGSGISYAPNERVNFSSDITLYAQWRELTIFEKVDGKTVKMTESVGSSGEASYGALVTLLSEEDIINAGVVQDGFTAADYIGLKLTYDWYGYGFNLEYCIYINKNDYSVSAPDQVVGTSDWDWSGYGEEGYFEFYSFSGELDTDNNVLNMEYSAVWIITKSTNFPQYVGLGLSFDPDNYKVEFGEIIE